MIVISGVAVLFSKIVLFTYNKYPHRMIPRTLVKLQDVNY